MADIDSREVCENCKFWEYTGHAGECHRYPNAVVKYQSHWCGEFKGNFAVAPLPASVGSFIAMENVPFEALAPIKKRGRPSAKTSA